MPVKFVDYSVQVKGELDDTGKSFLREAISELEAQTKKNTKVKTGRTKASIQTHIDDDKGEAYVGSDYQNFIWEELGTGQFAVNGNGRKKPWKYKDELTGEWYTTIGKRPRHMLLNAFKTKKKSIQSRAKSIFGGMGK